MSALHIAVNLQDNEDTLCFLASTISDINIKNKVGRTALHLSAKSGYQEYIKILLDYGGDRDIKDKFGKKAVDIANTNNHHECVEILLNYVAKKRLFKTCKDSSTTEQKSTHGEKISLGNNRKKMQSIIANLNEAKTSTTCSDKVLVDSSIYQIRVQNVDSPDKDDNLELHIPDSLAYNSSTNGNELEKEEALFVSSSSSCGKTNECAKEEEETQYNECHSFVVGSSERRVQDVTVQFPSRLCISEGEKSYETVEKSLQKKTREKSVGLVASPTCVETIIHKETPILHQVQCEDRKDDVENNNNIWNPNCHLSSKELEYHRSKYKDDRFQILPKELSLTNICQTSFKPQASSLFPSRCVNVVKNVHSKNGHGTHHKQLVHFDPYDEKDMFILISAICGLDKYKHDFPSNTKRNSKECDDIKNELQACFVTPVHDLHALNLFCCCERQKHHLKLFSTIHCYRIDKPLPADLILSEVLRGIKVTLNSNACFHSNLCLHGVFGKNGYHNPRGCYGASDNQNNIGIHSTSPCCSNSSHGSSSCYGSSGCHGKTGSYGNVSGPKQNNISSDDPLELFLTAAHLIATNRDDAFSILDKFCDNLDVTACKSLVLAIFTHGNFLFDSLLGHNQVIPKSGSILHAFDYVLQNKKTSCFLASSALEVILIPQNGVKHRPPLLATEPEFVKKLIRTSSERMIWSEDKVAEIFMHLCDLLSEELSLLYKYVDILLSTAFQKMDPFTLSSRILVRMGLLKSEFDVTISRQLHGPLLALTHLIEQNYFPSSLASLFVSFLTKPSPRFYKVETLRENALKAAILRELLQPSIPLGKGLKRIADVLAHGDFCETALQCCKALFEFSFSADSRFTSMEQGSFILIYLGLIKSEFPVDVIQNIQHGLELLLNAAINGYIPQSIAPIITIFLSKHSGNTLLSCKRKVEQIINLLTK